MNAFKLQFHRNLINEICTFHHICDRNTVKSKYNKEITEMFEMTDNFV